MTNHPKDATTWLYGFSAAQIQSYILSSPKLKEITGGSRLVQELCDRAFNRALCKADPKESATVLSQAAGGARIATPDREVAEHLYRIWPLVADRVAPGLVTQQALVAAKNPNDAEGHSQLSAQLRNSRAETTPPVPVPGPLIARNPRSGQPAVDWDDDGLLIDQALRVKQQKRNRAVAAKDLEATLAAGAEDGATHTFSLGRDYEEEGLTSRDLPSLGVIQADGNEVGRTIDRLLRKTPAEAPTEGDAGPFTIFSEQLKTATQCAARQAVREVLIANPGKDGQLLARPILMGGDDLCILVAGHLAIAFTECFLKAFEEKSKTIATELETAGYKLPGGTSLTACAGIAFVKGGFPFDRAHALAESLCKQAKRCSKAESPERPPSSIAFHRVTTSLPGDADAVLQNELATKQGLLTMEAYEVSSSATADCKLPALASLRELAKAMPRSQRGALRELLNLAGQDPEYARRRLDRMLEVLAGRGESDTAKDFRRALKTLGAENLWTATEPKYCPLGDAFILHDFEHASAEESGKAEGTAA